MNSDALNAAYFHSDPAALAQRFPLRATSWQLRTRTLTCGVRPLLMGIINVTPDSFSDGGRFHATDAAVARAQQLIADGADLLDIGGESTRPYATPVDANEELARVIPVLQRLAPQSPVPISIDTSKAAVAERALDAGAEVINDVTGLEGDPRMVEVARRYATGVCVMHMRGTPQTMQDDPRYADVVGEIGGYLTQRRDRLVEQGIELPRICLDPGIGFGKTHEHNYELMARCGVYHELGVPLLVGHSRKGFMAKLLANADADRTAATVGASLALARQGIQVLRVHDVRPVREALLLFDACGGLG